MNKQIIEKKFELTENFIINRFGNKLFQIKCTRKINDVEIGELGGFIEKESNLDHNGDARVYGDARVCGDAWVCGDARVADNNKHCGFDGFGSCNRHTHAYLTKNNKIEVTCGCFKGSIDDFEKKVKETHRDNIYGKEYKMIINLIKLKLGYNE